MIEMLTVEDLRRMLRRLPATAALPVEIDFDGKRVCLYGEVAVIVALHTATNLENDDLL